MKNRIELCFEKLKRDNSTAYIPFVVAGDPDFDKSAEILLGLPQNGADIVELGMPFSDPMADGPIIQQAALRALKAGHSMKKTMLLTEIFRKKYPTTPLILMGYYNVILAYGKYDFIKKCRQNDIDALIIVDLPAGQQSQFCNFAIENNVYITYLAANNTKPQRLLDIIKLANGFLYYVMVKGVTGTKKPLYQSVAEAMKIIKENTTLPVAVGFGVKKAEMARKLAKIADAVVVGSALVQKIAKIENNNKNIDDVMKFSKKIADQIHQAKS